MHGVNSVWHILGLCKSVFIARQVITFCFNSICIRTRRFQIHFKFSSHFWSFYLSRAVIGMLDHCDISLDYVLSDNHRDWVMLNCIILSLCTDRIYRFIEKISLTWRNLLNRVITADILLCLEISASICCVGVNKRSVTVNAINCA